MSNPKVSVLMSVHNGEKYLREAIESILNQTFKEFEFVIINDASTDNSLEIIKSYNDPRVRIINNPQNIGLTLSLNKGLKNVKGDYIARMDDDDISLPDRLKKQVAFMDQNPEIGVCGSWVKTIGETEGEIWKYPVEHEVIRCNLLFKSVLAHSSVIFRREFLNLYKLKYNPKFCQAQDYDLWIRCSNYFKLSNLAEPLVLYRLHNKQIGYVYSENQEVAANNIREYQLLKLGADMNEESLKLHNNISIGNLLLNEHFLNDADHWLRYLYELNSKYKIYKNSILTNVLEYYWFSTCYPFSFLGIWTWIKYIKSPLRKVNILSKNFLKFTFKCLLKVGSQV